MNKNLILTLVLSTISTIAVAEEHAKGRILISPQAGLTVTEFDNILKVHGGKKIKIGQSDIYIVNLPNGISETAVVENLKKNPHIKFAELDKKRKADFIPNDPYFGSEYHIAIVGAQTAWDTTQGSGVTIAILDSGVDGTHPDLVANLVPGYNFYDNNTITDDVCGHGTAVAGTSAAVTNNGTGVSGVAGQAKIMPIRISYFDTTANQCYGYDSMIANGLTYAADHGAKVANISYGGIYGSSTVINAANYFRSKGGLVFVSAGNSGAVDNTASTTSMDVVGATDQNDNIASFSTFGPAVTMSAPGVSIYTTSKGGVYQQWNGTSFSSPLTAGVAALMMSANPILPNTQIQSLMYANAVDLGAFGKDQYFGYGRVNAATSVLAAKNAVSTIDTTPPVISITSPTASSSVSGTVSISVTATDNVGVTSANLLINGNSVAISNSAPFSFSWDSTSVTNGIANLSVVAHDAAGNAGTSATVSVNVANTVNPPVTDTTPPVVQITNPVAGQVSGTVSVTSNATDNSGAAGITQSLYIDNQLKITVTGSSLAYSWNTRKVTTGTHTVTVIANDKAGNKATTSVQVTK